MSTSRKAWAGGLKDCEQHSQRAGHDRTARYNKTIGVGNMLRWIIGVGQSDLPCE